MSLGERVTSMSPSTSLPNPNSSAASSGVGRPKRTMGKTVGAGLGDGLHSRKGGTCSPNVVVTRDGRILSHKGGTWLR